MPEKVIHEIRLNQYIAYPADRTRRFCLGTRDSYGIEQLRIVPGEGWDGMTITATFHPPEGEAVKVLVPADGLIDVPPEATRSGSELPLKYGKIVFAGVADGMQRISCNLPYTVMEHAPVDGAESSGPAPSWYEQAAAHFLPGGGKAGQVLAKASDADLDVEWADGGGSGTSDHAKLSNRDAADQHPISAITGLQKELDGKQAAGNYLTADSLQAATDAALEQAKESGEFDGATGPAGADGITPTIGANGNWWIGGKDTGMAAAGQAATIEIVGTETLPADQPAAVVETEGSTAQARKYTVKVPQGNTGATPDIKIGTVETLPAGSAATASMTGTPKNPLLNLGIPKGADGNAGKTAYQYAVEGGYTGTEAEFSARMAAEIPTVDSTLTKSGEAADAAAVGDRISALSEENATQDEEIAKRAKDADLAAVAKSGSYNDLTNKPTIPTVPSTLPNPNALTFTGAVSATYDGSAARSVAIPTVPTALKNPNKLTFKGAVTAEYDGSAEVSVEIPTGGGGIYPVVSMTDATAELLPNTFYRWGEIAALSITLGAETEGITNEYCFEFVSGSTATTLTVPDTIRWAQEPSIEAGKTYQVSILNGIGVIVGA